MAGVHAKTANLNSLAKAQNMEKAGNTRDEIWKDTGWVKGKDNFWRFEIPDDIYDISTEKIMIPGEYKLGDLYKNEKLYEAYPSFKDTDVEVVDGGTAGKEKKTAGFYDPIANRIVMINYRSGEVMGDDAEQKKLDLVHEIQHMIQETEGFAKGGNPKSVKKLLYSKAQGLKDLASGYNSDNASVLLDLYNTEKEIDREFLAIFDDAENAPKHEELRDYWQKTFNSKLKDAGLTEADWSTRRKIWVEAVKMQDLADSLDARTAYYNLGGEEEARETSRRAYERSLDTVYRADYRNDLERAVNAYKALTPEEKKQAQEFIELAKEKISSDPDSEDAWDFVGAFYDLQDGIVDEDNPYTKSEEFKKFQALPQNVRDVVTGYIVSSDMLESENRKIAKADLNRAVPVIHDANAIMLFQKQAQIQGQTTVTGDMISLFDAADQSTFMHESAHWYLINMQKLALNENASRQFVEDFMTLQQWFGNKKLDADISVEQHEKFARGFEAYLRTGKAPAPQLHGIFNRFKTWLTAIYRDFKQLGGKPTKEVTAVMDRMLATEDEISMAMKEQMVDDFKRAGGMKLMLDENARTWERWYQKVKEEAEAKVLEKAMKDLEAADQKDIAEAIEAKRNEIAEEMGQDQF